MPKIPHVYYDKATGTYYAVASLGFDEITGKRMQKKKRGFKTQTEAKNGTMTLWRNILAKLLYMVLV